MEAIDLHTQPDQIRHDREVRELREHLREIRDDAREALRMERTRIGALMDIEQRASLALKDGA